MAIVAGAEQTSRRVNVKFRSGRFRTRHGRIRAQGSGSDEALNALSPREAKVLRMRFGIDTASNYTLEELGKQFDVTRERIRQVESKAMRKLMHPSRADKLREFLDR
jgi:DNA-directed RNA polymerase sigma subunit (sigma70/sigma32)